MGSGFLFHVICIFSLCIARSSFMEKSKTKRSPWIKSTKKPGPKKRKRKGFAEERKKKASQKATKALGSAKRVCRHRPMNTSGLIQLVHLVLPLEQGA